MAERLSWWVIPGALVVLARVVTLGGDAPAGSAAVPATAIPDPVVLRDAAGRRSDVRSWAELTSTAIVLEVAAARAGQEGVVTLWRRRGGEREAVPAFEARCRVNGAGAIPIAGLAAGAYDVQVTFGVGAHASTLSAAVEAPGRVALVAAASPVR